MVKNKTHSLRWHNPDQVYEADSKYQTLKSLSQLDSNEFSTPGDF